MQSYRVSVSIPTSSCGHRVDAPASSFGVAINRALQYLKTRGVAVDGKKVRRLEIVVEIVDPAPASTASGAGR